jgi:hypothetical protein
VFQYTTKSQGTSYSTGFMKRITILKFKKQMKTKSTTNGRKMSALNNVGAACPTS